MMIYNRANQVSAVANAESIERGEQSHVKRAPTMRITGGISLRYHSYGCAVVQLHGLDPGPSSREATLCRATLAFMPISAARCPPCLLVNVDVA